MGIPQRTDPCFPETPLMSRTMFAPLFSHLVAHHAHGPAHGPRTVIQNSMLQLLTLKNAVSTMSGGVLGMTCWLSVARLLGVL